MTSDAQKRATAKYQKNSTKQISLRFFPAEMYLYDFARSQDNTAGYLKNLIRESMERRGCLGTAAEDCAGAESNVCAKKNGDARDVCANAERTNVCGSKGTWAEVGGAGESDGVDHAAAAVLGRGALPSDGAEACKGSSSSADLGLGSGLGAAGSGAPGSARAGSARASSTAAGSTAAGQSNEETFA